MAIQGANRFKTDQHGGEERQDVWYGALSSDDKVTFQIQSSFNQ